MCLVFSWKQSVWTKLEPVPIHQLLYVAFWSYVQQKGAKLGRGHIYHHVLTHQRERKVGARDERLLGA